MRSKRTLAVLVAVGVTHGAQAQVPSPTLFELRVSYCFGMEKAVLRDYRKNIRAKCEGPAPIGWCALARKVVPLVEDDSQRLAQFLLLDTPDRGMSTGTIVEGMKGMRDTVTSDGQEDERANLDRAQACQKVLSDLPP